MKEFLTQQNGREYFMNSFHFLYLGLALLYAVSWAFIPSWLAFFQEWFLQGVAVLFLAECLQYGHKLLLRKLRRPKVTAKSILIFGFSCLVELAAILLLWSVSSGELSHDVLSLLLVLLVVLEHDINAVSVHFLNFFSSIAKRRIFRKAQEKRLSRKDLVVIGITGSFGKTSVKEYLSYILSDHFKVLKTERNTNTEIGIAHTILQKLKPEHQIFVCEMGAYTKGEIRTCAQIARPGIGIFTGLNNQHAALFGSLDDTFKSKWELVQALPDDGLAVFNGDSEELKSRLKTVATTTVVCSNSDGDAVARDIVVTPDSLQFTYKDQPFSAALVGEFQVVNLLMSIVVAEHLGMSLGDIAERIKKIEAPEKTMSLVRFSRGLIIDDSYNVNSDGLKQALMHLDQLKDQKKVLVFPGILELGEESAHLHETYGEWIGMHVDYAFFTDAYFSPFLAEGALKSGLTRQHIFEVDDQNLLMDLVKGLLEDHPQSKFVFLFESRGSEKIMDMLKSL
jgi:UDP-N-acetylmuramoyl-tripeptide--D-alanyl-D-alanine ligase